jgi:CRP/FNR family cyclic AMP-dependent transcriptional regulator
VKDTRPLAAAPLQRGRALADDPALAARAAELLRTPEALVNLQPDEAACVVERMRLLAFGPGVTLFRDGDAQQLEHLLLVLDGSVSVDTGAPGQPGSTALSVVGPGSILGEMSVLDGAPRSATCVTSTAVVAAGLSRAGLRRLLDEQPRVAAALLVGIGARLADRLRALNDHLELYATVNERQRAEIAALRGRGGL